MRHKFPIYKFSHSPIGGQPIRGQPLKQTITFSTCTSNFSGLAFTGALCGYSKQSIVEDSFHATTATVAAHELGHR